MRGSFSSDGVTIILRFGDSEWREESDILSLFWASIEIRSRLSAFWPTGLSRQRHRLIFNGIWREPNKDKGS